MNLRTASVGLAILPLIAAACVSEPRRTQLPIVATRATSAAPGLKVTLVSNNSFGSGTPIAPDVVISAAHVFDHSGPIAAVDGYPMVARHVRETIPNRSRTSRDDWMILESTRDRFETNLVDPSVEFKPGDRVYLAGYYAARAPADPKRFGEIMPEVVEGRVMGPAEDCDCPDGVVSVRVPFADYLGFSGGPVAIIDKSGNIRVWGVTVKQYVGRNALLPWRRVIELCVVRLPALRSLPGRSSQLHD